MVLSSVLIQFFVEGSFAVSVSLEITLAVPTLENCIEPLALKTSVSGLQFSHIRNLSENRPHHDSPGT